MRSRLLRGALAVGAVTALGAGGATAFLWDGGQSAETGPHGAPATAEVTRQDLVSRQEVDGTLEFADALPVRGEGQGRLTWLPEVGDVIARGGRVYAVNGEAVPLLYGSTPLWRALSVGVGEGKDVLVLERNLRALGFGDGLDVDEAFTWATARAVRRWQSDRDVPVTGRVELGDVVVRPGRLRVSAVDAEPGGPEAGRVLTATALERTVSVDLPVSEQQLAKVGRTVKVELPGGRSTSGRVVSVGTTASAEEDEDPQPGAGTETATVPVTIRLRRPSAAGRLDGAPVTVGFTAQARKDVLCVPVEALLAGTGGEYAVELVDGTIRRRVPVTLGVFADGRVEVTGNGLAEGKRVGVPST